MALPYSQYRQFLTDGGSAEFQISRYFAGLGRVGLAGLPNWVAFAEQLNHTALPHRIQAQAIANVNKWPQ